MTPTPPPGSLAKVQRMKIPAFVRQHVNKDGTPKVVYETEVAARRAAKGLSPRQYDYQCTLCWKWHLAAGNGNVRGPAIKVPWYGDAS